MILLLFTLFYLISILLFRKWIKNAYSENGVWSCSNVEDFDVIVVLIPIVNFFSILIYMMLEESWNGKKRPKNRNGSFAKRFFNIKD